MAKADLKIYENGCDRKKSRVLVFGLGEQSLLGAHTLSKASMSCGRETAKHNTAQTAS